MGDGEKEIKWIWISKPIKLRKDEVEFIKKKCCNDGYDRSNRSKFKDF